MIGGIEPQDGGWKTPPAAEYVWNDRFSPRPAKRPWRDPPCMCLACLANKLFNGPRGHDAMALFSQTGGPKIGQPVIYVPSAGITYYGWITAVSAANGTVSISYLVPAQTTLSVASGVQYDNTSNIVFPSWRYPEEYV